MARAARRGRTLNAWPDPFALDTAGVPLPTDPEQPWPPLAWQPFARDLVEASAWYSGDVEQLSNFYGGRDQDLRRPSLSSRLAFWQRAKLQENKRDWLHLPIAADIASASADLMFGEEPRITIADAHSESPTAPAEACEERLEEIIELDGVLAKLLEAAEVQAGLGLSFLRPVWDPEVARHPILTVVHGDRAVPEFRWGKLVAVTFWTEILRESNVVWRHLERYEVGSLTHGLYKGTDRTLGQRRPLTDQPATAGIAADADGVVEMPAGLRDRLLPQYVPNMLPNRKHRGRPIGRSDTAGLESLMDALDETWSSWVREIRLGKKRIIVPNQFLERAGRGAGATFDTDREIFSPLDMDPETAPNAGIQVVDFALRVQEHEQTAMALYRQIIGSAGYNGQTFGLEGDGGQQTATETRAKEGRSLRTLGRKQGYMRRQIADVLESMLIIDAELFSSGITPMRPDVTFGDPAGSDVRETAQTLQLLTAAQAASTETRVRMLHPEWDDPQVMAEVKLIMDEQGMSVATPTGAPGAPPDPNADPTTDPNFGG